MDRGATASVSSSWDNTISTQRLLFPCFRFSTSQCGVRYAPLTAEPEAMIPRGGTPSWMRKTLSPGWMDFDNMPQEVTAG